MSQQTNIDLWKERSRAISAVVAEADSVEEALLYAADLCAGAEPHEHLMGPEPEGGNMLAAPGLSEQELTFLRKACAERGVRLVEGGMREHVGGVEVGLAWALAGLADTGSCVVESTNEDVRLATMLPETGVLLLRRSSILANMTDSPELLRRLSGADAAFIAFISGPSRTADIERVLTLGVHGPLFQHVVLIKDPEPAASGSCEENAR